MGASELRLTFALSRILPTLKLMPSVATPERSITAKPEEETEVVLDQPWNVIIHNDPVNLMSYVAHVIRKLFGYDEKESTRLMLQVHELGRSNVWTGAREKAEHYVRELHAHQLLATIEQTEK
jgi:ATP-dependent Clp protease adaptor protein ClpS